MTVRQDPHAPARPLLDEVLVELLGTADRGDAVGSAVVAAVEGAALLATAASEAGREGGEAEAVELARQALGSMRAAVLATTAAVRTLADRHRGSPVHAGPEPGPGTAAATGPAV